VSIAAIWLICWRLYLDETFDWSTMVAGPKKPRPKTTDLTTEDPARQSRNRISEYLPQRRKDAKKKCLSELGALGALAGENI